MRHGVDPSEAERTVDGIAQRARVAIALTVVVAVALSRQLADVPNDVSAAGFVVAAAFMLAAITHEAPRRLEAKRGVRVTVLLADLVAASIAVAVLRPFSPLVPALFLWPLLTVGFAGAPLYLLAVASLGSIVALVVSVSADPTAGGLATAGGWSALYFFAGFAQAEIVRQFRTAHRATETAYAEAARLTYATTPDEIGEILFRFLDRLIGTDGTPGVLLYDQRGDEEFVAVSARGADAEVRARMRAPASAVRVAALAQEGGVWLDGRRLRSKLGLEPELSWAPRTYVVPIMEAQRLVAVALIAAPRESRLSDEARRGIARVAAEAAAALRRVHALRRMEQQRAAMSFLLDIRRAGEDAEAVGTWVARAASELTDADRAAFVVRERGGGYRAIAPTGPETASLVEASARLLSAAFARRLPILIPDASRESRFTLGAAASSGALVAVPLHGEPAAILLAHERPGRITASDVEFLIMLADQAALLLARARALAYALRRGNAEQILADGRVRELALHFPDHPGAELEARIVDAFRLAVEGNQPHLAGSGERVARLAEAMAVECRLPSDDRDAIFVAALLRDVGQLGIDPSVLERAGALTSEEDAKMRQHPLLGETILASVGFLVPASRIVRAHHERFDGSGYPDGLRRDDIPMGARILAVADSYCAMTSARPHRAALAPAEAVRLIVDGSGRQFDPKAVRGFVVAIEEEVVST